MGHYEDRRALATDPNARVMVFVDGQNLYKRCKSLFGSPMCHPHLLAEVLAGPRTNRPPRTRFYTGRPNPNVPGEETKARHLDRRLAAMRKVGVDVVMRPLRYHWDWGHRENLPRPAAGVAPQTVELKPWQRPQEKGIDLVLGLEVVEFLLAGHCDVAIIVSLDRDLFEIPQVIKNLREAVDRPVRVEAAVPNGNPRRAKVLSEFDYTHQITKDVFDRVRDDTFYAASVESWTAPSHPRTLAEHDAARAARAAEAASTVSTTGD